MVAHICERVVQASEAGRVDVQKLDGGIPNMAETFGSSNSNTTDLSSLTALSKMEIKGMHPKMESVSPSLAELCSRNYAFSMEAAKGFFGEELDGVAFEIDDTLGWP